MCCTLEFLFFRNGIYNEKALIEFEPTPYYRSQLNVH